MKLTVLCAAIGAATPLWAQNPTPTPTPTQPTLPVIPAPPPQNPIFPAPDTASELDPAPIITFNSDPNDTLFPSVAPTPMPKIATPATEGGTAEEKLLPRAVEPPQRDSHQASGVEIEGGNYTLDSPGGVIYDMERGLALASGNVTFSYREFVVTGDKGLVDYNTNTATLVGNLKVRTRGQTFSGQTLLFNLDTGTWKLSQLRTTFPPDFFPAGQVLEPIYLLGGDVLGRDETVSGQNFTVSSCQREHYFIRSKRLEFVRDRSGQTQKMILRKNGVYVFGRKILPLPVFTLNLTGQGSRLPLQVTSGQSASDGFFVKTLYTLRDDGARADSLLLDALQKRGAGVGLQRQFLSGDLLYLYLLNGRTGARQLDARVDKTYRFGGIYEAQARLDSTQNNEVSGTNSGSTNTDFTFSRRGQRAQTQAIVSWDEASFSGIKTQSGRLSLDHRQEFGRGYSLAARGDYNISEFDGVGPTNLSETLDGSLQFARVAAAFDLFLRAETHDDLVQNKTSGLERLPELVFQSSTERLKLPVLSEFLPGDFSVSHGLFNEPVFDPNSGVGGRLRRTNLAYNPRAKSWRLAGNGQSRLFLDARGSFDQSFYSNNTARYNYVFSQSLRGEWGNLRSQINYSRQKTKGFTPFQFDFFLPGEVVDASLSYQVKRSLRFNLTTGKDLENAIRRDITARLQWVPSDSLYLSLGAAYRQEAREWGTLYGNFRFNSRRNRLLGGSYALGVRYAPDGAGLTRANASADIQLGSKLRFQALASYNGINRNFDFTQYRLTQDLHCFNLFATYDKSRRELRFDLALKAFPFTDTRFGRNQFSEGFDVGVGDVR